MSERSRWSWDVPGFEFDSFPSSSSRSSPAATFDAGDRLKPTMAEPLHHRFSISTSSVASSPELARSPLNSKIEKLKDQLKHAREDYLRLRQEASDLKEYSDAKLDRVTRYLGVLASKARKLDQVALMTEARIASLATEKKRIFNDLLTAKGNIKVFCRTRPLFEDEGSSIVEFPDECTIRVNTNDDSATNPKKEYEFDRVYGPHIGQGEFFQDIQPFVQSALDGYNISIFAYGQSHSGKTYTMEGSNQERGLYQRCFEELFDLSKSDAATASQYDFYVTVFELYNDQARDLLMDCGSNTAKVLVGPPDVSLELVQEKVTNPLGFSEILKAASHCRGEDASKTILSHLIVTIHIQHTNWATRKNLYNNLTLVDLAASECLLVESSSGNDVTACLHVSKSLSSLGDVLFALSSKKEEIPYQNSMLTRVLADSLGGSSKTVFIANVCPNASNLSRTLSTLNFSARAKNAELSLGNRDTIKKWRDVANNSRKELYEKEKAINDLKEEILSLKVALNENNDQCILLFNEVQKAWKVSFTLQSDLKSENIMLANKHKLEKEQSTQLRNQVAHLLQMEQDQKMQIHERDLTIQNLQAKIKNIESQLNEFMNSSSTQSISQSGSTGVLSVAKATEDSGDSAVVQKKLEEELSKRDALIEKLHQENEKLFDRLTEKAGFGSSPQVSSPANRNPRPQSRDLNRNESLVGRSMDALPSPLPQEKYDSAGALVKSGPEKPKTTPAGEYLTAALTDFDPDQYESTATIADGANKLLMLVLAAVIKAGAAREHEILAEIRDAVFSFIRKMEPWKVMDTMLVSRVRILYIRSLLARSPELQSIKVSPVERFLEKANTSRSRSSSRSSSPGRSPFLEASPRTALVDEHIHGFKVNIKQEKKSKFSSIVLKLRGIDQEPWRQHVTGGKLREITDEAKAFAIGNKPLAALFVHTPAGELQRQIRSWLADSFEFLSVAGNDAIGGTTGQLELLSTAIMDGWMAGLGAAQPPNTDALGQLLSEYTKRVYTSQLQHLKDIAGTLAMEEAEDPVHVNKLRSALESVDHKRRKIMQQMQNDTALLTKEEGGSPIRNPSTAAEDARLASLISLDGILKQVKEIMRQASVNSVTRSKKKALLTSLDELSDRMPTLLDIDHPCAQRQIANAHEVLESIQEEVADAHNDVQPLQPSLDSSSGAETEVNQWNVLQFNTGSTSPFIIKCGANSKNELVIKAEARVQEPKAAEIIRVVPKPSDLAEMSFEEIKQVFEQLPESVSLLALARTADGTRARYSRLYRTLASKVPSLRDLVA